MVHSEKTLAHFRCKINIVKLENLEISNHGGARKIFLQYYVSVGSNQRIRIQTRHYDVLSCKRLMMNECANLQCEGEYKKFVGFLQNCNVVFEVCRRKESRKTKKMMAAEVIGRAEVSWRELLMVSERLVRFEMTGDGYITAAAVVVRAEAEVVPAAMTARRKSPEECGCRDCRWSGGCEDLFGYGVATAGFVDGF